jgi:heme/copper-type cytochrome/quinol oxidase subunit 1
MRNRNGASMKYFIVVGVLVGLAALIRFVVLLRFGVDIHIHDTYWVVPVGKIVFWLLIAIASVCFLIGAYKFTRHSP